jgi:hypothetical protein
MFRSRLTCTIGLGMTIAALGASTAGAQPIDLRTPDAIDAGQPQTTTQYRPSDLRSPDAVSAGRPKTTEPVVDMRTPDAKDHGEGRGTFSAPDVTVVKVVDPQPTNTGFDWGDAGIGAGGLLGLALIALGGTAAIAHHRQRPRTPSTV